MKSISEQETSTEKSRALQAIILGGLIAGTLDLTSAFIITGLRGGSQVRMLQSIASGLLGADSFRGGAATATLGVLAHFAIAFIWTIVFYLASRKIKFLIDQPIISGVLYGVVVYLLMYYVIVPLSAAPFQMPHNLDAIARDVFIHIICVGLPIALVVRRYSK
ncbi:MAG: hypothetical protein M3R14_14805 [Acidobacteriota bacterium]|nr:hypothetical protein [Acidobacteriota bacterium]